MFWQSKTDSTSWLHCLLWANCPLVNDVGNQTSSNYNDEHTEIMPKLALERIHGCSIISVLFEVWRIISGEWGFCFLFLRCLCWTFQRTDHIKPHNSGRPSRASFNPGDIWKDRPALCCSSILLTIAACQNDPGSYTAALIVCQCIFFRFVA